MLLGRRPQADPARRAVLRRRLADQRRDLGALDRSQVVDDPFRERLLRAGRVEVRPLEVRDDDAAALVDLRVLERPGESLSFAKATFS